MIVARSTKSSEPDLLIGNERSVLRFFSLTESQELAAHQPPKEGWTHDALEAVALPNSVPWNGFLGIQWVGSSEV